MSRLAIWVAALWGCYLCMGADGPALKSRIRVDSDLVLINAAVMDRDGHFVPGLKKDNFRLFDGNKEQQILNFSQDDAPVSMGIIFDASGSMKSTLPVAKSALREFLASSNPQDEFAAVVVRDKPDWTLQFTRDPQKVLNQLDSLAAGGYTALHDSIYLAAQKMRSAHNARKALLLITDGIDNHSRYSAADLRQMLQEADVTIYAIGVFRGFPEDDATEGCLLLEQLANDTGGRFLQASRPKDVAQAMRHLDVRNEYVLGFFPEGVPPNGKYHHVNLRVLPVNGTNKLRASWRRGYYAPYHAEAAGKRP